MRKNDYIKTIQDIHMPDDMRARIVHRMAQENGHKEVPISMFKHKKKRMAAAVIAATVVVGGSALPLAARQSAGFLQAAPHRRTTPACRVRSSASGMPVLRRLCYRASITALSLKTV